MVQQFARRGKCTDEMLELMRAPWQPGWTEFAGEFYTTPRLEMEPTPPRISSTSVDCRTSRCAVPPATTAGSAT